VDWIAAAHAQVHGTSSSLNTATGGHEADTESILVRKQQWEVFWRGVTAEVCDGANKYMTFSI
jgi:hypothetical protein